MNKKNYLENWHFVLQVCLILFFFFLMLSLFMLSLVKVKININISCNSGDVDFEYKGDWNLNQTLVHDFIELNGVENLNCEFQSSLNVPWWFFLGV